MAVRVGVIGAGVMGAHHIHTLRTAVPSATVTAVSDVDSGRAGMAAGPDAVVHQDPYRLISDDDVDAVLVASPDPTHEDYVLGCLAAGKPVLCEKPLTPTVDGSLRVVAAEVALGRRLVSVGFMRRYDPGYAALRRALREDTVGNPLVLHCIHRNSTSPSGFTSDMLVTSSAAHEIDLTRWLLGEEIRRVHCHPARRSTLAPPGLADPQLLELETDTGVVVQVEVFVNAQYGYDVRCEVVGERGALSLGPTGEVGTAGGGAAPPPRDWRDRFAEAYRRELVDWVETLAVGTTSGADAWDGYAASAVAAACRAARAAREPRRVRQVVRPALYG